VSIFYGLPEFALNSGSSGKGIAHRKHTKMLLPAGIFAEAAALINLQHIYSSP
jgi:hypothetical protein